jgi:hypothetical protein
MPKLMRVVVLAALIAIFLNLPASADFTVKTKMTMSGMPMMGNFSMQQTYLITGSQMAIGLKMENPMMGAAGGIHTRNIIRAGGTEMLVVNYADSTYSLYDKKVLDSMSASIMGEMDKVLDSLKDMLTIEKMSMMMTGEKKKINDLEAEELAIDIKFQMMMTMMGPEPTPMNISVKGSQWGTKQFAEFEFYKKMSQELAGVFGGGASGGFGDMMKFFEKLGMEKGTVDEVTKFTGYVVLAGDLDISVEMVMPDMDEEAAATMPGMTFNMKMTTEPVEASSKSIAASEFEIPKGFEKVESAADFSGGGFGFPGIGQ